jgi:hypothetical protein
MNDAAEKAQSYIATADRLRTERSTWDAKTADIAEIFRPLRAELRNGTMLNAMPEGEKRMGKVFDGSGILAANHLGGFIYSTIANPANQWLRYGTMDPDLNDWHPVKLYFEKVTRRVLASAQSTFSQFYAQTPELFVDLPVLGTGVFSSEVRSDKSGFIDVCRPLSECWFDVDAEGRVNAMYRRWSCTAAAAAREFHHPERNSKLSDKARDLARDKPAEKIELLHVVAPNDEYEPARFDARGKLFMSVYLEVAEKHVIARGGYEEFLYQAPRWATAAGEKYGRGHPGELALPDGGSLQAAAKANLKAAEWAADPAWGGPEDGVITRLRLRPAAYVAGAISGQGDQLVQRLGSGGSVPMAEEQVQSLRAQVKEFFFFSLMLMDAQRRTGMTDLEITERQQERMQIMGPYIGRLITEFLDPWARRRFAMLARLNLLPPAPRELQGKSLQVGFTSPLAMAQKAQEAAGVLRSWNFVKDQVAAGQLDVLDQWNGDENTRIVHDAFGAPARGLFGPDETARRRAQRQQIEAQIRAAQTALPAAQAAAHGANAIATLRDAQRPQPAAA